jgi:hypothetical protein
MYRDQFKASCAFLFDIHAIFGPCVKTDSYWGTPSRLVGYNESALASQLMPNPHAMHRKPQPEPEILITLFHYQTQDLHLLIYKSSY